MNKEVIGIMREWMAESGKAALFALSDEERPISPLQSYLARLLLDQGKFSEAEPLYQETLEGGVAPLVTLTLIRLPAPAIWTDYSMLKAN